MLPFVEKKKKHVKEEEKRTNLEWLIPSYI